MKEKRMESITRLKAGLVVFGMLVSFEARDGNWTTNIACRWLTGI
jgi:hypothetical protein